MAARGWLGGAGVFVEAHTQVLRGGQGAVGLEERECAGEIVAEEEQPGVLRVASEQRLEAAEVEARLEVRGAVPFRGQRDLVLRE